MSQIMLYVFVNKNSIKEKNIILNEIVAKIKDTFQHPKLDIFLDITELKDFLESFDSQGVNSLFMTSNNYAGVKCFNVCGQIFVSKGQKV